MSFNIYKYFNVYPHLEKGSLDSTSVTHKAHLSPLTNILHTECGQCGQMTDYCVIIPLHHEITIYLQQVPQRLPQSALSDVILTRRVIESSSFLALTFGSGEENLVCLAHQETVSHVVPS